jgi:hypothetical protein
MLSLVGGWGWLGVGLVLLIVGVLPKVEPAHRTIPTVAPCRRRPQAVRNKSPPAQKKRTPRCLYLYVVVLCTPAKNIC